MRYRQEILPNRRKARSKREETETERDNKQCNMGYKMTGDARELLGKRVGGGGGAKGAGDVSSRRN